MLPPKKNMHFHILLKESFCELAERKRGTGNLNEACCDAKLRTLLFQAELN